MRAFATAALALVLMCCAATTVSAKYYTSWITTIDPEANTVTFVNFPSHNCEGSSYNVTDIMNKCQVAELPIVHKKYTWNAFFNSTAMWFENYDNMQCQGKSILTRTYTPFNTCQNCPLHWPIDCKNGPFV